MTRLDAGAWAPDRWALRARRGRSTERAHLNVRERSADGSNAAISVQASGAGYEEAPGEDRGFVAEEESGIGHVTCDDLSL